MLKKRASDMHQRGGYFFPKHRSHSIRFTRAQGIPKYKIGFGREKDGRVGRDIVDKGTDARPTQQQGRKRQRT